MFTNTASGGNISAVLILHLLNGVEHSGKAGYIVNYPKMQYTSL